MTGQESALAVLDFEGRRRKKGDEEFVLAVAAGMSVAQAAEAAGIARSTAYRRLEEDEIRRAVAIARREILSESVGKIASATGRAVETLVALLDHEKPSVRLQAARALLGSGAKIVHPAAQEEAKAMGAKDKAAPDTVKLAWED